MPKPKFEGRKWEDVNSQAKPLLNPKTGEPVTEPYKNNPDVILEFGELDGNVVIRRMSLPNFYPDDQARQMADYGRKNIGNCPICEKYEHLLDETKKKLPLRAKKEYDSYIVDIDPSESISIRRIYEKDGVAVGYGLNKDKKVVPKKVAFPSSKFSKEEAISRAQEIREKVIGRMEKMKREIPKPVTPPPVNDTPPPVQRHQRPRIVRGVFPNVAEWRRERKRVID